MIILDDIGKLFNEHASAAVMKERLELAKDHYAELERKLAGSEAENRRLQDEGKRLVEENQRLNAEVQRLGSELPRRQVSTEILDNEKKRILIMVARHADPVSAREVAGLLSLNVLEVEQALSELERDKYIHDHLYMGKPPDYSLAEKGRRYLIENKLLGEVGSPVRSSRGGSMFPRVM